MGQLKYQSMYLFSLRAESSEDHWEFAERSVKAGERSAARRLRTNALPLFAMPEQTFDGLQKCTRSVS